MVSTWQNSLAQLKEFIKDNPSIEISENCISIPGDVRPEFYRQFDIIRTDFLKDNFPSSLEKGYELSKEFAEIYKEAIAASGLESISVRAAVNWFLQDPVNGLMRSLFDPIFNLIRGKLSEQAFAESATRLIDDAFDDYFREGYERWILLGLLSLMQPDKNYFINSGDFHTDSEVSGGAITAGMREEPLETVIESKKLAFNVTSISSFIVPRVLFHTQRLGCYVGIHTDFTEAYWRARGKSERVEWFKIKTLTEEFGRSRLWPDLLIYTTKDLDDLRLVADCDWVARPDIIVEVEESVGWYEKGGLDIARRHIAALKPRLGCYIVCRNTPPVEACDAIMSKPPTATQATPSNIATQESSGGVIGDDALAPSQITQELVSPPAEPFIRIIHAGYDFKTLDSIVEELGKEKLVTGNK